MTFRTLVLGALAAAILALSASAQQRHTRGWAANVIVPQARGYRIDRAQGPVQVKAVDVQVTIVEQVASTTLTITLHNPTRRRQEAEVVLPVPKDVALSRFSYSGGAAEPALQLLVKEEAQKIYDGLVRKLRDPALLEFAGYGLIRSHVFPIDAGADVRVRLGYEQLLLADGSRVDYVLPRSENVAYAVPWSVSVTITSRRPVSTVYSPSHALETERHGPGKLSLKVARDARTEPGSFHLSYLVGDEGVTASLLAYPTGVSGGYFLLLAGLPPGAKSGGSAIKREVTLVFDRSGSMNGHKLEQTRAAALQILAGLEPGETFNILVYNATVDRFAARPVIKTRQSMQQARTFLEGIQAQGGTNIHDALLEALRPQPAPGTLPLVLFLTDGLPTVGQTSEVAIRKLVQEHNPHQRRVFTCGVGVDVNTPLLESVALRSRATSTFILPKEDVELKVARIFERLKGPVLVDAALSCPSRGSRISALMPAVIPDLFEGDQLVVLGRYTGNRPLPMMLTGNFLGRKRVFEFSFDLKKASTKNAFVPRLWASRRIALLVDAIRESGAAPGPNTAAVAEDPKLKELVDEIVRLSTEHGILTEYTAFLALEGTDLTQREELVQHAGRQLDERAVSCRRGWGSVNQSLNSNQMRGQKRLNRRNVYWTSSMERAEPSAVQQVNDRAFFRRGGTWIDSRITHLKKDERTTREIRFGSPEWATLARKLASQNRQGSISLRGDILLQVDGEIVLVKGPDAPARGAK